MTANEYHVALPEEVKSILESKQIENGIIEFIQNRNQLAYLLIQHGGETFGRLTDTNIPIEKKPQYRLERRGRLYARALPYLAGNQIFMESVTELADTIRRADQASQRSITYSDTFIRAFRQRMIDVVLNAADMSERTYTQSDAAVENLPTAALIGGFIRDAELADERNFSEYFNPKNPRHPAIIALTKRYKLLPDSQFQQNCIKMFEDFKPIINLMHPPIERT